MPVSDGMHFINEAEISLRNIKLSFAYVSLEWNERIVVMSGSYY